MRVGLVRPPSEVRSAVDALLVVLLDERWRAISMAIKVSSLLSSWLGCSAFVRSDVLVSARSWMLALWKSVRVGSFEDVRLEWVMASGAPPGSSFEGMAVMVPSRHLMRSSSSRRRTVSLGIVARGLDDGNKKIL